MSRLEAFTVRKYVTSQGEEKSAWTKIGVAFPHNNGNGFSVSLDAIPAPTIKDGQAKYEIVLRPPMEKDDKQQRGNGGPSRAGAHDPDDSIPFARCDLIL